MQAIGIDLGTTSICGVIIDTVSGKVLNSKTVDSNAFIETENSWEKIQSPEKIIAIAKDILDEFITDDTAVIGVTGQMHGIVYTDKNGVAVSPLYTWQDGRGNLSYKDTTYADYLKSNSGYGNVTDFYNKVNGLIPSETVNYSTIHDYLVMHLCGLKKAKIHISDAASFGMFDLKTKKYNYECDIDVVSDYMIAGEYKGIPVSVAIGDNQASVFSSLAKEDEILINMGTGSQISIISDEIIEKNGIETRPYFDNKYLIVGAALCGGRAFAVLKDFYKSFLSYAMDCDDKMVYAIMDKLMEEEKGESLLVDTRFSGTRADETIRGSISGISTENFTPYGLTAGVLEGMINELYEMYIDMGVKRQGIVGSGNGIRKNKKLKDIAENKFLSQLKIPAHKEEAAYGAALFGTISSGIFKDSAEAKKLISYI